MAIHPDSAHASRTCRLNDGTQILIRPIRPEDAENEREFVNGLSDQSKYYRFMYSLNEITPEMLARYTQIDYDREMAFIALAGSGDQQKQIGVARYSTYPSEPVCEFAVVVADEWQGKGVGTALLRVLIESARVKGLERMEGSVLATNRHMLRFIADAGFEITPDPDDRSVVKTSLRL